MSLAHAQVWSVQRSNFCPGIPQYEQTNDLGISLLLKENPHIDWIQAIVAMNKDHQWILLPLAKPRESNPVHIANEINVN